MLYEVKTSVPPWYMKSTRVPPTIISNISNYTGVIRPQKTNCRLNVEGGDLLWVVIMKML